MIVEWRRGGGRVSFYTSLSCIELIIILLMGG